MGGPKWATADWCVPCKRVQPGWNSFAEPEGDSYEVFKAQIAFAVADLTNESSESLDGSSLSEVLRVSTLPTFVLLDREGQEVGRAEGVSHKRGSRGVVGESWGHAGYTK